MLAFLFNFLLLASENVGTDSAWGKFVHFWNAYANYPGFELWKFFNLAVFVAVMYYLLKKPLTEAFKSKRELIRAELIKAEEEKQAALAALTEAEARIANLDADTKSVIEDAKTEAAEEKVRITEQTGQAINKMRDQAKMEIDRKTKQVRKELHRFSAEESIRLAEEKIRNVMSVQKDSELVEAGIRAIGDLK